jgi:hypothetical protein
MEMRRHVSLKSNPYPESRCVYGVRMSGEGCVHYPGRSLVLLEKLPLPRGGGMAQEKSAEGIVGAATR